VFGEPLRLGQLRNNNNNNYNITALASDFLLQPIAVETLGPINESACDFLSLLAKKISQQSGDRRETAFLFK